jgi:hypothetical protein
MAAMAVTSVHQTRSGNPTAVPVARPAVKKKPLVRKRKREKGRRRRGGSLVGALAKNQNPVSPAKESGRKRKRERSPKGNAATVKLVRVKMVDVVDTVGNPRRPRSRD